MKEKSIPFHQNEFFLQNMIADTCSVYIDKFFNVE